MMLGASGIVPNLKDLDLPKLRRNRDEAMVLLDVIHVDVEDIRIKLAFSCREEVLSCIVNLDCVPTFTV
jgi:hypothetical protein